MQANSFTLTLEEAYLISPRVKHFIFHTNKPCFFEPGQFITLHFKQNDKILKRSYSIANAPLQKNPQTIEFAAGFVASGPGTEFLFGLKSQQCVEATGPFGRLILKDQDPHRYLFIATSTGITPYRSMLPELTHRMKKNPELRIVILQGVQHRTDILYHQEFKTFAAAFEKQVTYFACLSRETQDLAQHELKGHVQEAFPLLHLSHTADIAYLCGNPSMVDDAFNQLKTLGFDVHQIIREKYISR